MGPRQTLVRLSRMLSLRGSANACHSDTIPPPKADRASTSCILYGLWRHLAFRCARYGTDLKNRLGGADHDEDVPVL